MDFNKLNKIGLYETKPTKRFEELIPGVQYKVLRLKTAETQYGRTIIAVTQDFDIFLPERFRREMTDEDIELFNAGCAVSTVFMIYRGKKDFANGNSANLVEFKNE